MLSLLKGMWEFPEQWKLRVASAFRLINLGIRPDHIGTMCVQVAVVVGLSQNPHQDRELSYSV